MQIWIDNRAWQFLVLLGLLTLYIGIKYQGASGSQTLSTASYSPQPATSKAPSSNGSNVSTQVSKPVVSAKIASPSNDQTFNFSIKTTLKPLSKDAEVHIVNAFQGDDGKRDVVWWEKCPKDAMGSPLTAQECHRKWAGYRETNPIKVNAYPKKRSVLVLIAYEPVIWTINAIRPELIQKVVLGGYHSQQITGLPSSVPIEIRTTKASPTCHSCSIGSPISYASVSAPNAEKNRKVLIEKVEQITGLPVVTYQASKSLSSISISDQIKKLPPKLAKAEAVIDESKFIEQKYQAAYKVDNIELPLPAGIWKGLVIQDVQDNKSSDKVLVFYQAFDNVLNSLYAVRLINSEDGTGFPEKRSCKSKSGYSSKSENNQNFGVQDCYWLEHLTDPWQLPIFQLSAKRLQQRDIKLPEVIINSALHIADQDMSLTSYLYSNPEVAGINTQTSSWGSSPWHPRKLNNDEKRSDFVREQELTIKSWYQMMKVADLRM